MQDGRVVNCERRSYADLIFTFSSLEAEEKYKLENFIKKKITLFESYSTHYGVISTMKRRKDLQEYDEVKIIAGNIAIRLYITDDELEIHRSVTG